jgi:predicted acyltransferase
MTPPSPPAPIRSRLVSLDALRGFDMFWILGADAFVQAFGHMNSSGPAKFLAVQLEHREWAGFTFYDLIFPLFVFIVGVSLVFSLTKIVAEHGQADAVKRILLRAALLFLLGIFYNGGLARAWPDVRVVGVLQRIALAYAAAGLLFVFFKPRTLVVAFVALLAGYWALLTFVPIRDVPLERAAMTARFAPAAAATAPGAAPAKPAPPTLQQVKDLYYGTTATVTGKYEPGLNLANHFDFEHLPGRKYNTYWDPEGWLSTLPAIGTCLLGVFAGLLLRRTEVTDRQKVLRLVIAGAVALAGGALWGLQFPIIKTIWTSSFVLWAGGWSLLLLAFFYYVVDVRQARGWCQPFIWIGMNPITLYLATSVLNFGRVAQRFVGGDIAQFFDRLVAKGFGELVVALTTLLIIILLARFLYRRNIFLRV